MPALTFPAPILFVSSDPSFFGVLKEDGKELNLNDVTRIDFPLIEKGVINKEHLVHALKSLEQKEVNLIISDEIFLHHIADYGAEAQKKIAESIKETVSSVFSEEKDPLHIVTVDLAKTSKLQTVQISALTKQNLSLIQEASEETGTKLASIVPASFVIKAFVSVDPSLFVLQTQHSYLLTSHYIGVDFATNINKDDEDALVSTIKKLKKERDHIQHVYICTDEKDLLKLHEKLESVMPVQDVEVKNITTERDTPYFLTVLCAGLKDVVENDFPFPVFAGNSETPREKEREEKVETKAVVVEKKEKEVEVEEEDDDPIDEEKLLAVEKKAAVMPVEVDETEVVEETDEEEKESLPTPLIIPKPSTLAAATTASVIAPVIATPTPTITIAAPVVKAPSVVSDHATDPIEPVLAKVVEPKVVEPEVIKPAPAATVVKRSENKKGGGGVFKYVFLTLGVAVLISLIGGGIVISQQALGEKKSGELQTPVAEATSTPTEDQITPTPKPTAEPVDMKTLTVNVVNATKIAGKAGKVATAAKKTGVKQVDSGNAKGTYEEGTYIMFAKPELSSTKEKFEEETGLTFEVKEMEAAENPGDKYDVVIVLAE